MKISTILAVIAVALAICGPAASAQFNAAILPDSIQAQANKLEVVQAHPIYNLRVHAIKLSNDDGSEPTPITPQQVKQWVDKANHIFYISGAGINLQFDPNPGGPDWKTLKNSRLNHISSGDQSAWADANKLAEAHPGKILFLFRYSAGTGANANKGNGFAFPPQSGMVTNFIALPGFLNTGVSTGNSLGPFVQNIWQLAHDTGHYLGLAHTFPGWADDLTDTPAKASEYIKNNGGTAAALDGDKIADTPPEAGTSFYAKQGWNYCAGHESYTINGKLGSGANFSYTFTPDRHNVMSYFACETMKFTKGQVARMRQTLQLPVRKHLIAPFVQAIPADQLKKLPARP
jgi:hypothetical protein